MKVLFKNYKYPIYIFIFFQFTFSSTFAQDDVFVYTLEEIKKINIIYKIPDFQYPALIVKKTRKRPQGDIHFTNTINLDKRLVKFSSLSSYATSDQKKKDYKQNGRDFKLISKQMSDYLVVDSTIICLFSERYEDVEIGWFDLLIFSKHSDKIFLREIYPVSFGSSFYFTPKITHINKDTVKIGGMIHDETEFDGNFKYLIIKKDSVVYYRNQVIHGLPPSIGNPIPGATTKRYYNEYFDENGEKSTSPIYYECKDENGNEIYGQVVNDSLSLYKQDFNYYAKSFIKKIKVNKKPIKVGAKSIIYGKPSSISVEIENKWYWVPAHEVKL